MQSHTVSLCKLRPKQTLTQANKTNKNRNVRRTQVRKWSPPNFSEKGRVFAGKLSNPCPARDGGARAHFYNPSRGEWVQWVNMLPDLQIPDAATMGDIVVPNAYTAQYNSLLTLLLNRDKKTIVCGPTGTGKSTYVFRAITQALPQDKFKPLTLGFSAKTSANMTQDIIDGKLDKRRKGPCVFFRTEKAERGGEGGR